MLTRGRVSHSYAAGRPRQAGVDGHAIVHENPRHGVTALSAPVASWAADNGAPYYNSGYQYPAYAPLHTGGSPQLMLPREAEQLDLSDMATWDRPVYFTGVR
jgi:hypothetical protein